jgi:hypothetical protein
VENVNGNLKKVTEGVGPVTGRNTTFEVTLPGGGLVTVMEAVLGDVMSSPGTVAVNCELLTNVVAKPAPFQFTTAPLTKPVPFTVSVNPAPAGATGTTAVGISGWLIRGTGFGLDGAQKAATPGRRKRTRPMANNLRWASDNRLTMVSGANIDFSCSGSCLDF